MRKSNEGHGDGGRLRLATVAQIPTLTSYSWLTESALRHLIFHAEPSFASDGQKTRGNGLVEAGVIIRIGRKVLIDLDKFDEWLNQQRQLPRVAM